VLGRLIGWIRAARRAEAPAARAPVAPGAAREQARLLLREAAALVAAGREDEARERLERLIALGHEPAEAHYWLGAIHEARGETEDAADCYRLAVHFDPTLPAAQFGLARLHEAAGRYGEAATCYRAVLEHDPDSAAAHANLCHALYRLGRFQAARAHGSRALELDPALAEARHNLGLVLLATGEPAQAAECFERAFRARPRAEVAAGLGHALRDLGRLEEAIAAYDRALAIDPQLGDARINRAYAFLLAGEFEKGWAEYEERFVATATRSRDFGLPRWRGEPLPEATVLVHAEQGIGDEIMFASCIPDLAAVVGRVVIECSARLEALFRRSFPWAQVHGGAKEDPPGWLARFAPVHCQVPIGSLPRYFRRSRAAFEGKGAYLRADPGRVQAWRERLGARAGRLAVGLSWRGGTPASRGGLRSIGIEALGALARAPCDFVSVQHGAGADELERAPLPLVAYPGVTEDLDELAALLGALDLVVSADNTNVHLAGALGRPVWVLLSPSPEWRYGLHGDTMPWYPSARLFRRRHGEDWGALLERVAAELVRAAGGPTEPRRG
jgi:tetratricopeptide (TPR) repeat protein